LRVDALSERLAASLNSPEQLARVAERVQGVARDFEITRLVGASEAGRRIVEAVAQLRSTEADGAAADKVLLVDGLLVTGTNLAAAAERVRAAGATQIVVVVALADETALIAVRQDLSGPVLALEIAA
jgi:uracil phosphoribosyltransferase